MKLKTSLAIELLLGIVSLTIKEIYWRSQDYYPTLNDDKSLWAILFFFIAITQSSGEQFIYFQF